MSLLDFIQTRLKPLDFARLGVALLTCFRQREFKLVGVRTMFGGLACVRFQLLPKSRMILFGFAQTRAKRLAFAGEQLLKFVAAQRCSAGLAGMSFQLGERSRMTLLDFVQSRPKQLSISLALTSRSSLVFASESSTSSAHRTMFGGLTGVGLQLVRERMMALDFIQARPSASISLDLASRSSLAFASESSSSSAARTMFGGLAGVGFQLFPKSRMILFGFAQTLASASPSRARSCSSSSRERCSAAWRAWVSNSASV